MIGTEANEGDFEIAKANIVKNSLDDKIKVIHNKNDKEIFPKSIFSNSQEISFSVCNPPFFEANQQRPDRNVFEEKDAGREHEMVIEGESTNPHFTSLFFLTEFFS